MIAGRSNLATPAAIVVAGALIGAGLFFGLRRDGAPEPPVVRPRMPEAPQSTRRDARPADRAAVMREVAAALEAQRAGLASRCWTPAPDGGKAAGRVRFTFNFTFDAEGNQVARGVIEDLSTARAEVTACMLGALAPIRIAPPGTVTPVDVPFELP